MYDIITKKEYFDWFEQDSIKGDNLKHAQDGWIKSLRLDSKEGQKIAEIGGGDSRILSSMAKNAECWNIDKLEGAGNGPTSLKNLSKNIKIVKSFMGSFNPSIPQNYFDSVFSISVIEHVPTEQLTDFYKDCHRILKPNGVMAHAIDLYLTDEPLNAHENRIDEYLNKAKEQGFKPLLQSKINPNITFKSRFASNPDHTMAAWNRVTPSKYRPIRENHQVVSIKFLAHG
jgi:cyclopropane fatty-acyl-phospholipid synthase-like methyltransferase